MNETKPQFVNARGIHNYRVPHKRSSPVDNYPNQKLKIQLQFVPKV